MQNNFLAPETMALDFLRVAQENDIPIEELSFPKYMELGGKYRSKNTWSRKGGFRKIISTLLPNSDKELGTIYQLNQKAAYINKLEKTVGLKQTYEEMVSEVIRSLNVKIRPQKRQKTPPKSKSERVHVVALLNDLHIGLKVDAEEIGGLNSFDFKEAGRRIALHVKEIANYKKHKRKNVEKLQLLLNGDILTGIIHSITTQSQHLMIHQMNGALHILTHAITYLSGFYSKIDIHCVSGNHDRMVHKENGKRPVTEIYDNYANIVYYALSAVFKSNKNIYFNISKTPYCFFDLPAGRAGAFHGDHLFSSALRGISKSINVKALNDAIRTFNAGEIAKGNKPLVAFFFSHVHSFCHFITPEGVEVYISPSLCGVDGFAHSLGINDNFIAQPMMESTPKYIIGDARLNRLNSADADESLDDIIPIYNKELKCK
jgi:hypothetical protein